MQTRHDSITVVTVTRGRPHLLGRAIESVQRQDYAGPVRHMLLVDDCMTTAHYLAERRDLPDNLIWQALSRSPGEISGPARLATLRNYAVNTAQSDWISFLDDDNEFEVDHLRDLIACAHRSGCLAVHSHMRIFQASGAPYLEQRLPWARDPARGVQLYKALVAQGVFQPGSNIVRDRADSLDVPDPVRTVDTGEWLLARALLLMYPFCETYDDEDLANVTTEDDKLLDTLIQNRVAIACSERPTFRYYLGGYSNAFNAP